MCDALGSGFIAHTVQAAFPVCDQALLDLRITSKVATCSSRRSIASYMHVDLRMLTVHMCMAPLYLAWHSATLHCSQCKGVQLIHILIKSSLISEWDLSMDQSGNLRYTVIYAILQQLQTGSRYLRHEHVS